MTIPAETASGEPDTGQNSLRDIEGIIFSAQLDRGIADLSHTWVAARPLFSR